MRHATLGASSAERWMACPGSVALEDTMPPSEGTFYTREGTAAHALLERCLRKKIDAEVYLDTEIKGFMVTDEMAEAVQVFVDLVRSFGRPDEEYIEQTISLAPLNPPEEMFGTTDWAGWWTEYGLMRVLDFKYGTGVAVDATANPQMRYYALGTCLSVGKIPTTITNTIVQPRGHHPDGPVRSETLTFQELSDFQSELFEAARATQDPNAPLMVGDWCRFCRALPVCPAQQQHALEVVQSDFEIAAPPAPETLTVEQLTYVQQSAGWIQDWLREVNGYIVGLIEDGKEVPGWKLVPKRAVRRWVRDESEVEERLKALGLDDPHTQKLYSPAQAERAIKAAAGMERPPDWQEWFESKSSGPKLVPESDPRPALPPASEGFAVLPSGE